MEDILFIIINLFLIIGAVVYIFFPKKYLKYREKAISKRDIIILRIQGVFLLCVMVFLVLMYIKNL